MNFAIILFGGHSTRFIASTQKQLYEVNGHPLAFYAIRSLATSALIDKLIIVTNDGCKKEIEAIASKFKKDIVFVNGGLTRNQSVKNALDSLIGIANNDDNILIHDGARLCLEEVKIADLLNALTAHNAATLALPMEDTIAATSNRLVQDVPNRANFVKIQTPQAFKFETILKAHLKSNNQTATDDTQLVLNLGEKVAIVEGSKKLNKITTIEDIESVKEYLK